MVEFPLHIIVALKDAVVFFHQAHSTLILLILLVVIPLMIHQIQNQLQLTQKIILQVPITKIKNAFGHKIIHMKHLEDNTKLELMMKIHALENVLA